MAKKETKQNIENIVPGLEEMLKAGVHFGHRTSKWDPKMKPYIFGSRNNVHIIDLEKTQQKFKEALEFISQVKEKKGTILFVGTKISAKEIIRQTAEEIKMPYVAERWLGGTLTNFQTISKRLEHFRDLEKRKKEGALEKYTKKERHDFDIELNKLERQFGGIKKMTELPNALFVASVHNDKLAVKEAKMKKIPVIGICDTNSDPAVDYPIPGNDDAISSLRLILGAVARTLK